MSAEIDHIPACIRRTEVEMETRRMPDPNGIHSAALRVRPAPASISASSYGAAIDAMRDKGYTWNEVRDWLADQGADFSVQAMQSGWRTWQRDNG